MIKFNPLGFRAPADGILRMGGSTGDIGSFGMTRDGGKKMHNGVDWITNMGDPVFAAHDGVIRDAGLQRGSDGKRKNKGYGIRVYVKNTRGGHLETVYAHLSGVCVENFQDVVAGQLIGWAGVTGNADVKDMHLHFGVRIHGEWVDPLVWLSTASV